MRLALENGGRRLQTTIERARHDCGERHIGEPTRRTRGLLATDVVEVDARGASGEDSLHVGGGAPVPDEKDCGHGGSLTKKSHHA